MTTTNEARKASPLEHVNAGLEVLVTLAVLYRFTTGEDPLELVRGWYDSARDWLRGQQSYRRAMLETLERIRDLPETEGEK